MTRRWITVDTHGTVRSGPFGAWWAWILPRPRYDIPTWRVHAWNVLAVGFTGADLWWAHQHRILWPTLAGIGILIALTACRLIAIQRRIERDAARNVAIAWAAHEARQAQAATESERVAA